MNRGFVSLIIVIIIGLILLKYFFDFSIFDALETEQGRVTLEYTKELLRRLWDLVLALIAYIR